jgi:hypothetical protein
MIEPEDYMRRVVNMMVRQHYQEAEKLIEAAIAEHKCKPSDLMLDVKWDGTVLRARLITDEERWLDWQSNNHGWSRS